MGVFCPSFGRPLLHPQLLIPLPFKVSLPSAPAALLSLCFFFSILPINLSSTLKFQCSSRVTSPVLTSFHRVYFIILETELILFAGNSQINIFGPRILSFRGLYLVFNWTTPLNTPQTFKTQKVPNVSPSFSLIIYPCPSQELKASQWRDMIPGGRRAQQRCLFFI